MKHTPKNIPSPYKFAGTKIFRDTTALPFADGGPLHDRNINGKLLNSTYASPLGNMFREGGPFGENKGMFDYATSIYASQPGNYYANGGYTVRRSNDRKGKTHVVTGPDGTKKYFGDPSMGERSKSKNGKEAFYARHKHNLKNNPYFRAYARATWELGGQMNSYANGGQFLTAGGEYHKIYKNADGDIIVNHPKEDKGKWDTINLTNKANAKTIAEGIAATKKWHAENPNVYKNGGLIKRADGSYSPRGLWDNIRANKGSGKKPTKEMLEQERKINREYRTGGQFPRPYSLPEDSFKQGGKNLHNSIYASSLAQYPAVYAEGGELESGCPPGSYWNGKACVKLPKGVKVITDPKEYEFRKAAYDDSMYVYNRFNKTPKAPTLKYSNVFGTYTHPSYKTINTKSNKIGPNYGSTSPAWNAYATKIFQETGKFPMIKNKAIGEQKQKKLWYTNVLGNYGFNIGSPKETRDTAYIYKKPKQSVVLGKEYPKEELVKLKPKPKLVTKKEEIIPFKKEEPIIKKEELIKQDVIIDKLPIRQAFIDQPEETIITQLRTTPEKTVEETDVEYSPEYIEEGVPDTTVGMEWVNKPERYINWQGTSIGYRLPRFRKPGHGGDLIKKGKQRYIHLPTIETRNTAELVPDNSEYKNGGMMSRFYASNVPDNNISNKDLTYPENSYVYAVGGNLNNSIMNKYPNVTNILRSGIHINPANKGKFTASANAAGMGVQEFASHVLANKDDYSSTQVKRANFARNAAKWKHEMGGNLNTTSPLTNMMGIPAKSMAMTFKYGGFNNPGFNALPKEVQAKIKARTFENGGTMPQLTEFNEGGRHEENPLGGIPQGVAGDGRLNLVEEGETKLNAANYIFSDTLKLNKGIAEAFNLPKGDIGKTFSDISKRLNRPNSRRDNDTIEQNAIQRDLENLMQAQEAFKEVDLQKDIEMMKTKHPEFMGAIDAAMQQQSAQQQEPSPEEMQQMQNAPQPGSPEEQAMMEQQMMAQQQAQMDPAMMEQMAAEQAQMSPEEMAQIPMSYGGSMYMHGGHMYGKGGNILRSIGAGAYGVGEGMLDTLTGGATDFLTDKGYDALAGIGNRDKQDLERDRMIRGFSNTAGAITGAVVSGGSATGSAISQGSKGLGEGLSNIHGTNKEFDKTVNSLAKVGSVVGGLVGGGAGVAGGGGLSGLSGLGGAGGATGAANAAGAAGAAGAAAQGAGQVPQFAQSLMQAGQNPFFQQVAGMAGGMMQREGGYMYPSMYKYGGSFEMPRQQMYMPLDNVERMGGHMYIDGGMMDPPDGIPLLSDVPRLNINGKLYTKDEALQASAFGELLANPEEVEEYFADNILMPQGTDTPLPPLKSWPTSFATDNTTANNAMTDNNLTNNTINTEGSDVDNIDTDETTIKTQDEEDLENITSPGSSNTNIITGGKGNYSDMNVDQEILAAQEMFNNATNPKDKASALDYLSKLKRMKTDLENRNVDLTMKQTPLQALGLALPAAYNIGMGLFSKPTKFKEEEFMNKARVTPYKVNIDPQLNEARLAYNAAEQGIRNAAPGGGAYLTNRANLASLRAKSFKDALAGKENADAQLQMQADLQNAQLGAQNIGNKLAIQQLNAQAEAAKQRMLQTGIGQIGQIAQNAQAMDAQEKYMRLISPQYGKTFEYQTIFDQLKNYYKNKKSSK